MCRTNFPKGRLCSASKMLARRELESYVGRYKEGDNYKKYSTPSGEYTIMAKKCDTWLESSYLLARCHAFLPV